MKELACSNKVQIQKGNLEFSNEQTDLVLMERLQWFTGLAFNY